MFDDDNPGCSARHQRAKHPSFESILSMPPTCWRRVSLQMKSFLCLWPHWLHCSELMIFWTLHIRDIKFACCMIKQSKSIMLTCIPHCTQFGSPTQPVVQRLLLTAAGFVCFKFLHFERCEVSPQSLHEVLLLLVPLFFTPCQIWPQRVHVVHVAHRGSAVRAGPWVVDGRKVIQHRSHFFVW